MGHFRFHGRSPHDIVEFWSARLATEGEIMKRIVVFAATAVLGMGMIPFAASARSGHAYQPIGDTGVAVGVETPSSQARTCVFVETPTGWHAVGIGAGVYYASNTGKYDAHNQTTTEDDGSICDSDQGDEPQN